MSEGSSDREERTYLIEAIYRIVGQVERKYDALRDSDLEAFKTFRLELSARLDGFPALYATQAQLEQILISLRGLETSVLSRQIYEQNHQTLEDHVIKLDREKLPESVFETFIENYRIDQEKNIADRKNVVDSLAHATNQVRDQLIMERSEYITVDSYQHQHAALMTRVEGTERWQYKIVGGLVFATFIAPLLTGIIVYLFSKGIT